MPAARRLPIFFGAALLAVAAPAKAAVPVDLVIRHVSLIDVAGGRTQADRAIALRGERIVAVGPDKAIARRYRTPRTIDARGRFAMPGLWDMHVHFGGGAELVAENRALLPLYLAFGVTTVRDCAADLSSDVLQWRTLIADKRLLGPKLLTSGPKLEGPKPLWKGTIEVDSPAEVKTALDRLQAMRVDFVKITDNTLRPPIFLEALRQARARGLRTSAHMPAAVTVEQAVRAGLSSIEHLDYMIKAGSPDEARLAREVASGRIAAAEANERMSASFDAAHALANYRKLARLGLAVTPTLNMSRIIVSLGSEDHRRDPGLALIGSGLRQTYDWRIERARGWSAAETEARRAQYRLSMKVLPLLQRAGVPILAGTDAGYLNSFNYPGIGLHDELERYVEAGLTPAQALRSATITGPAFMGLGVRYGAIAPGKVADILLLDANPLKDISATRKIRAVVTRGRLLDRAALDSILAKARADAAAVLPGAVN